MRYDTETQRVKQSFWGHSPDWVAKNVDGKRVAVVNTTQQARTDALTTALDSVEAGTDYDPDTETPVGKLCYDPDADELYGEVEIQPLTS